MSGRTENPAAMVRAFLQEASHLCPMFQAKDRPRYNTLPKVPRSPRESKAKQQMKEPPITKRILP
jgi:hypothetical protein